jgi:hypothetical protein
MRPYCRMHGRRIGLPVSKIEAISVETANTSADVPAEIVTEKFGGKSIDFSPQTIPAGDDAFAPWFALQTALRFWWFLFLLVIAGGLVAWLVNRAQPPLYEAVARFSANIDYVSTGPLTQYEEDTALNGIGNVILGVAQEVVDRAKAGGIHTSLVELKRASVLERRFDIWELRVRNSNPQVAEQLANLWVEQGEAALKDGYQHALQADHLNHYLLSMENCLAKTAASEPASAQCSQARFAQIQADIRDAGDALAKERLASRGMFSGVMIGPVDRASLPDRPVIYNRSQMILAGCLIGFLLGVLLLQFKAPARWLAGERGRS